MMPFVTGIVSFSPQSNSVNQAYTVISIIQPWHKMIEKEIIGIVQV